MSEPKKNKLKIPTIDDSQQIVDVPEEPKQKSKAKTSSNPKPKSEEVSEEKITIKQRIDKCIEIYNDSKTQRIIGLLLILSAVYLVLAFKSFVFTWKEDQDKVFSSVSDLFADSTKVANWLGKVGAMVSHLFMFKWFGVSSFLLAPILLISGLKKIISKDLLHKEGLPSDEPSLLLHLLYVGISVNFL